MKPSNDEKEINAGQKAAALPNSQKHLREGTHSITLSFDELIKGEFNLELNAQEQEQLDVYLEDEGNHKFYFNMRASLLMELWQKVFDESSASLGEASLWRSPTRSGASVLYPALEAAFISQLAAQNWREVGRIFALDVLTDKRAIESWQTSIGVSEFTLTFRAEHTGFAIEAQKRGGQKAGLSLRECGYLVYGLIPHFGMNELTHKEKYQQQYRLEGASWDSKIGLVYYPPQNSPDRYIHFEGWSVANSKVWIVVENVRAYNDKILDLFSNQE